MDPYSADGELVNIHTAFHQGQYQEVISTDTSSLSSANTIPARLLQIRSQCALRQYDDVLSSISSSEASSTPDLAAARLLAQYGKDASQSSKAVAEAEKLAESQGDNLGVQICCGTVLAAAGEHEKALALLKKHQGSLDAVAIIVQIYLEMNRTDLAAKECKAARSFAQDAPLVNLGEAWVGMREGGEKYQQSFYVFEELAQAPSTSAAPSLTAQAVSELHLGRLPEAETALQQAIDADGNHADALANQAVLHTINGQQEEADASVKKLQGVDKAHPMLADIAKRKAAFDAAAAKYNPKFEP